MKANIDNKYYGNHLVLQKLRFSLDKPGSIALVGLNGSGKSTLLKVISGICQHYEGEVDIQTRNVASLIDGWGYFTFAKGRDMIEYLLDDEEQKEAQKYLDIFKVNSYIDESFRKYSLGMKQRLALVVTLARKSDLLLLDEPINGLDPEGISEFKNIIIDLKKTKTIIISTHILTDISSYCDQVFILEDKVLKNHEFSGEGFRCSFSSEKEAERFYAEAVTFNPTLDGKSVFISITHGDFKKVISVLGAGSYDVESIDKSSNSINYNLLEKML